MVKIYLIGLCILIVAIIANAIIIKIGLMSWYDFIELLTNDGASAFKKVEILEYFWLFFGYPLVLGFGYVIGIKLHSIIF
ncbi:hypothetical protein MWU58_06565 [Flavobacteriaceae bacterium S0825]|uniref:DUF7672 family protein n=1 Tax=Gaetbulibacter sp. S0825 TaxID=2720084 RepID=UPI0014322C74|nr:hypothetical protein [Gaetbulibacter sp. S0825]MCK0108948.1 hypothetical protein [Flavobacteriaceae bacterium S0825]NIX64583.1 hypothetical protein [Gaetbulibacter sp. S0825]